MYLFVKVFQDSSSKCFSFWLFKGTAWNDWYISVRFTILLNFRDRMVMSVFCDAGIDIFKWQHLFHFQFYLSNSVSALATLATASHSWWVIQFIIQFWKLRDDTIKGTSWIFRMTQSFSQVHVVTDCKVSEFAFTEDKHEGGSQNIMRYTKHQWQFRELKGPTSPHRAVPRCTLSLTQRQAVGPVRIWHVGSSPVSFWIREIMKVNTPIM